MAQQISSRFFITSDGVRLHYLDAARRASGDGPSGAHNDPAPLVMLPGWTQPAEGFAPQFASLPNLVRCVALDYRGHGESDRVARLARDCLDLLDHLGLDQAVLLGHSAGCTVIWSFIELFGQDRIRGIVLADEMVAAIRRPEWTQAEVANYGAFVEPAQALQMAAEIAGPDGEQTLKDFLTGGLGSQLTAADVERLLAGSLRVPRAAAAQMMLSVMQSDFRDVLPLIARPTLCIGGEQSHLGPAVMPWIAAQISGSHCTMLAARHFVHLEAPQEFNAAVSKFLATAFLEPLA